MLQRHLADAAGRLVHDPQERQVVARVEQQPQVGQHVAVLLAVEERQALDDLERHALLDERRFQAARQGVDAQEDGEIAVSSACRPRTACADAPGDALGLVQAGLEGQHRDRLAGRVVGDEVLRLALLVVGDQAAGGAQDRLGAAVVLRQRQDAGVGEVALEIEDIADVGAAQFVNRLVRIADDAQVRVDRCDRPRAMAYWAWLVSWYSSMRT